jgi:hypothetical protein
MDLSASRLLSKPLGELQGRPGNKPCLGFLSPMSLDLKQSKTGAGIVGREEAVNLKVPGLFFDFLSGASGKAWHSVVGLPRDSGAHCEGPVVPDERISGNAEQIGLVVDRPHVASLIRRHRETILCGEKGYLENTKGHSLWPDC